MRILVVEDDKDLNRQMVDALLEKGYVVDKAFDGEEGHFLGDTEPYDAIVLDLGLPVLDGVSVLSKWRRAGRKTPVLHMEEILARLRALVRRAAGIATSELTCGPVALDTANAKVTVDGRNIKLTSLEFRLLSYLMHHPGKIVSRTELVEHLYDQDFDRDSNTVEVFVGRLRKKLSVDVLQTVRGMGYVLEIRP